MKTSFIYSEFHATCKKVYHFMQGVKQRIFQCKQQTDTEKYGRQTQHKKTYITRKIAE